MCVRHSFVFVHVWPILPHCRPPRVVLLLHLGIHISPSWCSTPGLSCGQIAALFISLVINITHCTATFSGNNTDNGASALLSLFCSVLFFSQPHCRGESHFCEQQAHTVLSPGHLDFHSFFQTSFHLCWMVLSLAAGYRAVSAFQSGSTAASCSLNNNRLALIGPLITAWRHHCHRLSVNMMQIDNIIMSGCARSSPCAAVIWIWKQFSIDLFSLLISFSYVPKASKRAVLIGCVVSDCVCVRLRYLHERRPQQRHSHSVV